MVECRFVVSIVFICRLVECVVPQTSCACVAAALDPAAPLFESYSELVRLDAGDAQFVDAIHTSADALVKGGLGVFKPLGHADFYPGGGRFQQGCSNLSAVEATDIIGCE